MRRGYLGAILGPERTGATVVKLTLLVPSPAGHGSAPSFVSGSPIGSRPQRVSTGTGTVA
jgi:hypothetical protein